MFIGSTICLKKFELFPASLSYMFQLIIAQISLPMVAQNGPPSIEEKEQSGNDVNRPLQHVGEQF